MRSNKKLIVWQLNPGDQVRLHFHSVFVTIDSYMVQDGNGIRQAEIIVRYSPEESDQTIRSASWRGDSGGMSFSPDVNWPNLNVANGVDRGSFLCCSGKASINNGTSIGIMKLVSIFTDFGS